MWPLPSSSGKKHSEPARWVIGHPARLGGLVLCGLRLLCVLLISHHTASPWREDTSSNIILGSKGLRTSQRGEAEGTASWESEALYSWATMFSLLQGWIREMSTGQAGNQTKQDQPCSSRAPRTHVDQFLLSWYFLPHFSRFGPLISTVATPGFVTRFS